MALEILLSRWWVLNCPWTCKMLYTGLYLPTEENPWWVFWLAMGPGQYFVARVGLGQPFMVWVRIWKFSPKYVKFFNFFPLGQKNIFRLGQNVHRSRAGGPLIYCGSKVSSRWVRSGPISNFDATKTSFQVLNSRIVDLFDVLAFNKIDIADCSSRIAQKKCLNFAYSRLRKACFLMTCSRQYSWRFMKTNDWWKI